MFRRSSAKRCRSVGLEAAAGTSGKAHQTEISRGAYPKFIVAINSALQLVPVQEPPWHGWFLSSPFRGGGLGGHPARKLETNVPRWGVGRRAEGARRTRREERNEGKRGGRKAKPRRPLSRFSSALAGSRSQGWWDGTKCIFNTIILESNRITRLYFRAWQDCLLPCRVQASPASPYTTLLGGH